MTGYLTTCLACGSELAPVVTMNGATAPWGCPNRRCFHSWFAAELTDQARRCWRGPRFHDFGIGAEGQQVIAERAAELEQAKALGVSVREDQLALLDKVQLDRLGSHFAQATSPTDGQQQFAAAVTKHRGA